MASKNRPFLSLLSLPFDHWRS